MSKKGASDLQRLTGFQIENYHRFSFGNNQIEGVIYPSGIGHTNDYIVKNNGLVKHMDKIGKDLKSQIGAIVDLAKLNDSKPQEVIDNYGGIIASVDFSSVAAYSEGYAQAKGEGILKAGEVSALIISYAASVKSDPPAKVINEIVSGSDITRDTPRSLRDFHRRAFNELVTMVTSRAVETGIDIAQAASLIIDNSRDAAEEQQDIEVSEMLYPNQGASQAPGGRRSTRRRRSVVTADDLEGYDQKPSIGRGLGGWETMANLTMAGVEAEDSTGLGTIAEDDELEAPSGAGSVSSGNNSDDGYGTRTPSPQVTNRPTDEQPSPSVAAASYEAQAKARGGISIGGDDDGSEA